MQSPADACACGSTASAGGGPHSPAPMDPLNTRATADETQRTAYARCIRWLGQRDHSSAELRHKLGSRGVDESVIEAVLTELRESRYVDDERYALTFAEQRSGRGYGPRYISAKLYERGVDAALADQALESLGANWELIARQALTGRFPMDQLADASQRQQGRMARFLQSRGFSSGDALRAIRHTHREALATSCADFDGDFSSDSA